MVFKVSQQKCTFMDKKITPTHLSTEGKLDLCLASFLAQDFIRKQVTAL